MSSGGRPIGTAKGKQPHTEALCQPPPPPVLTNSRGGGGTGAILVRTRPQRGGGVPQNGCTEQWVLWAPGILL